MVVSTIRSVTFGIEVKDLATSTRWYERLLGRPPQSPGEGIVEFPLGGGVTLMLSASGGASGVDGSVNLEVDDLDETRRAVEDLGLAPSPVGEVPGVLSYFEVADPDGHSVTFVRMVAEG